MELLGIARSYFGGFLCVCWSPDGKYIVVGGEDDLVTVWSLHERRVVARGQGHRSWVSVVAFDPYTTSYNNWDGPDFSDDENPMCEYRFGGGSGNNDSCPHDGNNFDNCEKNSRRPNSASFRDSNISQQQQDKLAISYRLGSVSQDTQLCLWDITEDVLSHPLTLRQRVNSVNNEIRTSGGIHVNGELVNDVKVMKPVASSNNTSSNKDEMICSNSSSKNSSNSSSSKFSTANCTIISNDSGGGGGASSLSSDSITTTINKHSNSNNTKQNSKQLNCVNNISNIKSDDISSTDGGSGGGGNGSNSGVHNKSSSGSSKSSESGLSAFNSLTQRLTNFSFGSDKNKSSSSDHSHTSHNRHNHHRKTFSLSKSSGSNYHNSNQHHHNNNNSNNHGISTTENGNNSINLSLKNNSSSSSKSSSQSSSIVSSYDPMKLIGTPACPRFDECPLLEPLICKKIAHERLTALIFREDCFLTACQDGFIYTWARPGYSVNDDIN